MEILRGSKYTSILLTSAQTTNFIFKVEGVNLSEVEIEEINSISTSNKVMDRVRVIKQMGGRLEFANIGAHVFSNNLTLIDSRLPEIMSHVIYQFYSSKKSKVADLVADIAEKNPSGFDNSNEHKFYEYKIKRLLTDAALGMDSEKVWTGQYDAAGGYMNVKENGKVLCYHIYNKNEFEDYLFNNTKLETASSKRHEFGFIYEENGQLYFKLNLQIRFIK